MDAAQNQGSQPDGNSPEPSQTTEGNNPAPSQEDTGQVTDQQLEQMLPGQDERGVPAENVLGEMRRKMDKLTQELEALKSIPQQPYQQPQQVQQPYQQSNLQQQPQQMQNQQPVVPKTPDEIAEIVEREAKEKYGESLEGANYWELQRFHDKRFAELNQSMINEKLRSSQTIQAERANSFNRVKNLYPDLSNVQSQLTQGVFNEVNRRAYLQNMSPQAFLERDPYAIESITPLVASQLGIGAKVQNPRIQPRQNNGLPPNNFEGRQTPKPQEIRPNQDDVIMGQRFGVKPEAFAKARVNKSDPTLAVDKSNVLLS